MGMAPQRKRKIRKRKNTSRDRSLMRQLVFGFLIICVVIAMGWGAWYVTRLSVFTISQVTVEGGETISHDALENTVDEILAGAYLGPVILGSCLFG